VWNGGDVQCAHGCINPLMDTLKPYSNRSVHWPVMGELLHLVQWGGPGGLVPCRVSSSMYQML